MKIFFLVSDSRSGSTLLSRELTNSFDNVVVTPEIKFNSLFNKGDKWVARGDKEEILDTIFVASSLRNIDISRQEVSYILDNMNGALTIKNIITSILTLYLEKINRSDSRAVVIKKGLHLLIWKKILRCMPDAKFIHIYRDPRAVINSKLRTQRVYVKGEPMGWGGAFISSCIWKRYSSEGRLALKSGAIIEIPYEKLIQHSDAVIRELSSFLGEHCSSNISNKYLIPNAERHIHTLVFESGMKSERVEAWRSELSFSDLILIETITGREMALRSYQKLLNPAFIDIILTVAKNIPSTAYKIVKHYMLTKNAPSK